MYFCNSAIGLIAVVASLAQHAASESARPNLRRRAQTEKQISGDEENFMMAGEPDRKLVAVGSQPDKQINDEDNATMANASNEPFNEAPASNNDPERELAAIGFSVTDSAAPPLWGGNGCPQPYQHKPYFPAEVVSRNDRVYRCAASPMNLYCGMTGYTPAEGFAWQQAWTLLGSCAGAGAPTSSPNYESLSNLGGCPSSWMHGIHTSYQEGDRVAKDKLVFRCKAYPNGAHCSQMGYEPLTNLATPDAWKDAWELIGYCDGDIAPTPLVPTPIVPTPIVPTPNMQPTPYPTKMGATHSPSCDTPSKTPTRSPTIRPTIPVGPPTPMPTLSPICHTPTPVPTPSPTKGVTHSPSCDTPSKVPTPSPTKGVTHSPSCDTPSKAPTPSPSKSPACHTPTHDPTKSPTSSPSIRPTTNSPTTSPTPMPTKSPTPLPTCHPPTDNPTKAPTLSPTSSPSVRPTASPSSSPTPMPTKSPTPSPTCPPPTNYPTKAPTLSPTSSPSVHPTASPSSSPTPMPTGSPTKSPHCATKPPTSSPTIRPTVSPTASPTQMPTKSPICHTTPAPTKSPHCVTNAPTNPPTIPPTPMPTKSPICHTPTNDPTPTPTKSPHCATNTPTPAPSIRPTMPPVGPPTPMPTMSPTKSPTCHTASPTPLTAPTPPAPTPLVPTPTPGILGSMKWYVKWDTETCTQDCNAGGSCGGLAKNWEKLFNTAAQCCHAQLSSKHPGWCEETSKGNPYPGGLLWYVETSSGESKCARDCASGSGVQCGGIIENAWVKLSATADICCQQNLSSVSNASCVTKSTGILQPGSGTWYVDHGIQTCVQDCEGPAPCGGFKENWEKGHPTKSDCCGTYPWFANC